MPGRDQGDAVADFLTAFLKSSKPLRLVHMGRTCCDHSAATLSMECSNPIIRACCVFQTGVPIIFFRSNRSTGSTSESPGPARRQIRRSSKHSLTPRTLFGRILCGSAAYTELELVSSPRVRSLPSPSAKRQRGHVQVCQALQMYVANHSPQDGRDPRSSSH